MPSCARRKAVAPPMFPGAAPATMAILSRSPLIVLSSISSLERCALSNSVLCDQHQAELCLALHHASVSISSLFERSCLDHRADILQAAEGKSVLLLDRRAGQGAVDRASSKDERERTQLNLVRRYTHHDELAAGCKTGHKWPHTITTGGCCENRSGPAHTL